MDSEQERIPPVDGKNLVTTMDVVMQQYAEQTIAKAVETKGAKRGIVIILNPQNGGNLCHGELILRLIE